MTRPLESFKFAAILLLLAVAVLALQKAADYRFAPAGAFPSSNYTIPLGVSDDHIVGYYSTTGANNAYVQMGTTFVDAAPFSSVTSYLTSINKQGTAAGGYCPRGCNEEAGAHGYTYDVTTGKMNVIDFPLPGAATTAYGINDAGTVVGGYCPSATSCPQGAFNPASDGFVEKAGTFTTLNYPGAQATSAFAINDPGVVVGYYLISNTGPHAFLYESGKFKNIDFPGSGYTIATAINNHGVVAGLFSSSTGVHGYTYSNGTFTQVDKPGAVSTAVTGINDLGELVGTFNKTIGQENFKAVPATGR
ncbi:MAG TPA: hypothetical protein VND65_15260 [Candidatus Binatia bacterium]|nr:hypothetical protein [Candidatus Binatia bacterium]